MRRQNAFHQRWPMRQKLGWSPASYLRVDRIALFANWRAGAGCTRVAGSADYRGSRSLLPILCRGGALIAVVIRKPVPIFGGRHRPWIRWISMPEDQITVTRNNNRNSSGTLSGTPRTTAAIRQRKLRIATICPGDRQHAPRLWSTWRERQRTASTVIFPHTKLPRYQGLHHFRVETIICPGSEEPAQQYTHILHTYTQLIHTRIHSYTYNHSESFGSG